MISLDPFLDKNGLMVGQKSFEIGPPAFIILRHDFRVICILSNLQMFYILEINCTTCAFDNMLRQNCTDMFP